MRNIYLGIFFTALSTLMYEILLTRIFSVTMGYHFAFMAVSIAMFGMTIGALLVTVNPAYFLKEPVAACTHLFSLLFSITIIISFLIHLYIPFLHEISFTGILIMAVTYTAILIPFTFSGICICLMLTLYSKNIGRVYAADLIGASVGCVLLIFALNISGGTTSVFITSFFAALGAVFFALNEKKKSFVKVSIGLCFAIGAFIVSHSILVNNQRPLIKINSVHGGYAENSIYEKWNSFSRVSVTGDTSEAVEPFGWGLSSVYDTSKKVRQLMLNVDAHSTTVLTGFNGDLNRLEHLKYDIANTVHYLRPRSDVLIIGTGGGRDILSSVLFKQNSVLGVEINQDMICAVNDYFGDFTGHLDKYANVTIVADEARSYITRRNEKFDIIQLSVIDNWAATSSGAFVLTENALYTKESWKVLIDHLKPNGILAVTRYYRVKPVEIYRLTALSSKTLIESGADDPRKNIIILKNSPPGADLQHPGTGTMLMSKAPFSKRDLDTVSNLCGRMKFEIIYSPEVSKDSVFSVLSSGRNLDSYFTDFPVDISPPTDDNPFFFLFLRFRDALNKPLNTEWDMGFNLKAFFILFSVLCVIIVLTLIFIFLPLKIRTSPGTLGGSYSLLFYFACIGLGFMLIEISQIQRLSIFLGHPTYSLSVSLFSLLLATGIGSYMTSRIRTFGQGKFIPYLLLALMIFGILTPYFIDAFRASDTPLRITVAAALLFPIGLFMGTAFPAGIKLASEKSSSLIPWLWGINGAASVLASVFAIIIAMAFGIKAAFWSGFGCYVLAGVLYLQERKKTRSPAKAGFRKLNMP